MRIKKRSLSALDLTTYTFYSILLKFIYMIESDRLQSLFSWLVKQLKDSFREILFFEMSMTIFIRMHFDDNFFEKRINFFLSKHIP